MGTAILRLLQCLGKSRLDVFLKEKVFWQKASKWIFEGIDFLERKVTSCRSCSFVLQAVGLALSLISMSIFASAKINVLHVAGLVHSVIA